MDKICKTCRYWSAVGFDTGLNRVIGTCVNDNWNVHSSTDFKMFSNSGCIFWRAWKEPVTNQFCCDCEHWLKSKQLSNWGCCALHNIEYWVRWHHTCKKWEEMMLREDKGCKNCKYWTASIMVGSNYGCCRNDESKHARFTTAGSIICNKWEERLGYIKCESCAYWSRHRTDAYGYCHNAHSPEVGHKRRDLDNCPVWEEPKKETPPNKLYEMQAVLESGGRIRKVDWHEDSCVKLFGNVIKRYQPMTNAWYNYDMNYKDLFLDEWELVEEPSMAGWGLELNG